MEAAIGDWNKTPQNWRPYYAWMAKQWTDRVGTDDMTVPIWCWHSCNGILESCPTVGTFCMLMGDWNYYAPKMVVLELNVPEQIPLLSSYSRWNQAIDDAIDRHSETIDVARFDDMFDTPLFKHDLDDIQAVIPKIERSWVTRKWLLPACDESEMDWELPCRNFMEMPGQEFTS